MIKNQPVVPQNMVSYKRVLAVPELECPQIDTFTVALSDMDFDNWY